MGRTLPNTGESELESTFAAEQELSAPALVILQLRELVTQWKGECARAEQVGEESVVEAYKLASWHTQWTLDEASALKERLSQEEYITEATAYLQELGNLARASGNDLSANRKDNEVCRFTQARLREQILLALGDYAHPE